MREKEAELARLTEEIAKKTEELEAKEGQLVNKEYQYDQMRKQAMREVKLNKAKEIKKLREKITAVPS